MLTLNFYDFAEIFFGIFSFWVGVYLLSKNPFSKLSWIAFALIAGFGLYVGTDPIYTNATTVKDYVIIQKILDPTLFFAGVFCLHASLIIAKKTENYYKALLVIGYLIAAIICILDIKGGYIVNENLLQGSDIKYGFMFKPGPLMWPVIIYVFLYLLIPLSIFFQKTKENFGKYILPGIGILFYIITDLLIGYTYHYPIPYAMAIANIGMSIGTMLIIFSIIRYHLFADSGKTIFNKNFLYRTAGVFSILTIYTTVFLSITGWKMDLKSFIFLEALAVLLLTTHSFYEWYVTFINDLSFNFSSGLSVVNDEEVYQALRNYNNPEKLENISLLRFRLNLISNGVKKQHDQTSVDALRQVLKEAVEYFKPGEDDNERTKQHLKYHLLKMLSFKQAEEGQILWELGFDEYPVRIMSRENNLRKPLFEVKSPSDYTYTSRNAYLALKKEAIHDVTWRISYLEKNL